MVNPTSLATTRLEAGLSLDDLSARAAAIGHRWLDTYGPDDDRGPLREDLHAYIQMGELGELTDPDSGWFLQPTHPYIKWLAEALDTTPLRLIDEPIRGVPRV